MRVSIRSIIACFLGCVLFLTLGLPVNSDWMNLTGAESLGLGPGDSLVSSPETMFDIAGVYPLKMKVVGLGVFDNFDSRPPTEGDSVKNDLGIETMISWKFK